MTFHRVFPRRAPLAAYGTLCAARKMPSVAVISFALCGAFPLNAANAQHVRPIVTFPGLTAPVALDTTGNAIRIAAPPGVIYTTLRAMYGELKVPLEVDDSVGGMLGNLRMLKIRSLGKTRLSLVVDCGGGMSGPLADNARVQMAMVSMLKPITPDTTEVRTAIVAAATSLEGSLRDPIGCSSSRQFELKFHDQLVKTIHR